MGKKIKENKCSILFDRIGYCTFTTCSCIYYHRTLLMPSAVHISLVQNSLCELLPDPIEFISRCGVDTCNLLTFSFFDLGILYSPLLISIRSHMFKWICRIAFRFAAEVRIILWRWVLGERTRKYRTVVIVQFKPKNWNNHIVTGFWYQPPPGFCGQWNRFKFSENKLWIQKSSSRTNYANEELFRECRVISDFLLWKNVDMSFSLTQPTCVHFLFDIFWINRLDGTVRIYKCKCISLSHTNLFWGHQS